MIINNKNNNNSSNSSKSHTSVMIVAVVTVVVTRLSARWFRRHASKQGAPATTEAVPSELAQIMYIRVLLSIRQPTFQQFTRKHHKPCSCVVD